MEHMIRACLIALRLAESTGLDSAQRGVVYYSGLLAWVGWRPDAYEQVNWGVPLVLLHGGMVSANPIWAPTPVSYSGHIDKLASRFQVIAPDTRGSGPTVHDDGTITYDQLADDVLALIEALELDRPLVAGFSDGGMTAAVAAIRQPAAFLAIVKCVRRARR
jgi:pimeloyl-ACP methyl ester carboxylesterase